MPTKQEVLDNINKLGPDDLCNYIKQGIVTFEELRKTGKFEAAKQTNVRLCVSEFQLWEQISENPSEEGVKNYLAQYPNGTYKSEANALLLKLTAEKAEDELWAYTEFQNTLNSYREYLSKYPNGKFSAKAKGAIERLEKIQEDNKKIIINNLLANQVAYTPEGIKKMIKDGTLSKEDLINYDIITEDKLELYLNPDPNWETTFTKLQTGWDKLEKVEPNRTDIYFLGIAGSGKTCMLSGLLYYGTENGLIRLGIENDIGKRYADFLIQAVAEGFAPPSTITVGINYMPAELSHDTSAGKGAGLIYSPINIIEMSGEIFQKTYETFSVDQIKYIKNDNRKIIFLVVDYEVSAKKKAEMLKQRQILDTVLQILEKEDVLNKTDGVFIVLTKSDLLPGGSEDIPNAKKFIDDHYKSIDKTIKDYYEKYKFKHGLIPFSLGRFMLGRTFDFEDTHSKKIFKLIIESAFLEKKPKRTWFS